MVPEELVELVLELLVLPLRDEACNVLLLAGFRGGPGAQFNRKCLAEAMA